ncbi:MAG: membrane protein insertase YidC [Acidobacteria bacterium]|nr:membrane protein insertase YidC [Acidobacteriota bacterium]
MEKRVLFAAFLSFLVLFIYQALFVKPVPPKPAPGRQPATSSQGVSRSGPPTTAEAPLPEPSQVGSATQSAVTADVEARDIVVESGVVTAVFSNRGAVLKSWQLKAYRGPDGRVVDLVPPAGAASAPRPFDLDVAGEIGTRLRDALFKPSASSIKLTDAAATLTFDYLDASGLSALKTFVFPGAAHPYEMRFSASVTSGGQSINPLVHLGAGLGDITTGETSQYIQKPEAIYFRDGKVTRLAAGSLVTRPAHEGRFGFAGVDDHYFVSVAVGPPQPMRIEYRSVPLAAAPGGKASAELVAYGVKLSGGATDLRFFIGPKDFDVLGATDRDLVRTINFGIFAWLVVPLLRSLKWIDGYVGNYGWSIIILTILINAVMFPLRHKSVVSMRKMQEIQPEVKAIQDRYAKLKVTDPARQKMNTELMGLYRQRGVNPASGCIPMVLTMPVLFAFYSLLSQAIEIRGAPFVLWIRDLSAPDPWYVTPLLMGGTMVWQQKMTPTTADPLQQRMMMMMPIVFTFMFLWAPSGLVLYWLVSNLWGIGQQQITNRIIGPPTVKIVRPPAERRMKKVGAGKTQQADGQAGA